MNNAPKMTRKYKYAKIRYEIELENISHVHNEERKKYRNIQLTLTISIISIFMSIGLLMGTTFAWFSSSVSNTNNVIKSGHIDLKFSAKHENGEIINLINSDLSAFNVQDLSPDKNEIVTDFTIENTGSLPFDCYMYFQFGENDNEGNLREKILVSVKNENDEQYSNPVAIGSLIDENHCVFNIDSLQVFGQKKITVKLTMANDADQGKDLKFNICLFAKQVSQQVGQE